MDLQRAIRERLAFALQNNRIDATYREQILSVGAKFIRAQAGDCKASDCLLYLPYFCCLACDGDTTKVVGVTTSWFLLQVAAYLLDKVEDLELADLSRNGMGMTANLSTGMIFIAEWILNHLELDRVDPGAVWDIQRSFHESVLSVCSGQHRDLCVPSPDLDDCWSIAREKSGAAFGLACYSGGRVATHDTTLLRHLESFGKSLGVIVQIGDDLEELKPGSRSNVQVMEKAPIFRAYRQQIASSIVPKVNVEQPGVDQSDEVLTKSSVLYLFLEGMKLAELAKRELDSSNFREEGKSGLLKILNHRPIIQGFVN